MTTITIRGRRYGRTHKENEEFAAVMKGKKVLFMTLKAEWFDMILSSRKKEEYRAKKEHWRSRLFDKTGKPIEYDLIHFSHGYSADCRKFLIEFKGVTEGPGRKAWGGGGEDVFVIGMGDIKAVKL